MDLNKLITLIVFLVVFLPLNAQLPILLSDTNINDGNDIIKKKVNDAKIYDRFLMQYLSDGTWKHDKTLLSNGKYDIDFRELAFYTDSIVTLKEITNQDTTKTYANWYVKDTCIYFMKDKSSNLYENLGRLVLLYDDRLFLKRMKGNESREETVVYLRETKN